MQMACIENQNRIKHLIRLRHGTRFCLSKRQWNTLTKENSFQKSSPTPTPTPPLKVIRGPPAREQVHVIYNRSEPSSWKSNESEDFSTGTWQASAPTKSRLKTKAAVWCLTGTTVVWNKLATCSSAFLAPRRELRARCFWRFGVRAPLLDGSATLTNICTDMKFDSERRSRCCVRGPSEVRRKITLGTSFQPSLHCGVNQQPLVTPTQLKTTLKLWGDICRIRSHAISKIWTAPQLFISQAQACILSVCVYVSSIILLILHFFSVKNDELNDKLVS